MCLEEIKSLKESVQGQSLWLPAGHHLVVRGELGEHRRAGMREPIRPLIPVGLGSASVHIDAKELFQLIQTELLRC